MFYGWQGQYLEVNLTVGEVNARKIGQDVLEETIGGIGLAAYLVDEYGNPDVDPFGASNTLVICAGPLGGTTWAGSGRLVLAGKSPLTGLWGEASVGGYFATQLKRAGYDAVLLKGASELPVILVITQDRVEIQSAEEYWGMDTYAVERELLNLYPKSEVLSIGPAGEKLVPMASIVHHKGNNVASRCGLGAVFGSKKLKAIVAKGAQEIPLADVEAFNELKKEAIKAFNQDDFIGVIRRGGGTAAATPIAIEMADLTAKNWDLEVSEWGDSEAQKITGPAMKEQFPSKTDTCYACPVACKWSVEAALPEGGLGEMAGPEYESLAGLGAQVMVSDPLAVVQANDLCNRLGIDTISTGGTIAWALEAYERGLLPEKFIDPDLELGWASSELVLELVRRIGNKQEGMGELLGKGSLRAAEQVGAGEEFSIQVKGLELPYHHPRALRGLEVAYATLPRGASHNEEGVTWDWEDSTYQSWVAEIITHMDRSAASSSMVYCQFLAGALDIDYTIRLLEAVTGRVYTEDQLEKIGERTWFLRRIFNLRAGMGLEGDSLPDRITTQINESSATLKDLSAAVVEYHIQRELDPAGIPSKDKLMELGLDKYVTLYYGEDA
jgi:aldehyde:ferredoxin oxidoreductase